MASFDELRDMWQSGGGIPKERFDAISANVKNESELLRRSIFHRDLRETYGCALFAIGTFVLLQFWTKNQFDRSGHTILLVLAIVLPLVLWWARRQQNVTASASDFRDFLNAEISYLYRQVLLAGVISCAFLVLLLVAVSLITIGLRPAPDSVSSYMSLFVTLGVGAGFLFYLGRRNYKGSKDYLEPLLKYYVEVRDSLDSVDEFETDMPQPPTAFVTLQPAQRKPISSRRRVVGILLTIILSAIVLVAAGYVKLNFDARTGNFLLGSVPVVAILIIFVTGIWRRNATETSPEIETID